MDLLWINNTRNIRRALSSKSGFLVREMLGFGLPDKDHISARAPQQHGATYIDTFFRPRECSLVIYVKGCNAEEFQAKHHELVRAMNPLDDCQLRIETDGHVRYTLTCRPITMMEVSRHNAISADVLVQLIADDPFFHLREWDGHELAVAGASLRIPFTIPDWIASAVGAADFVITNNGHVLCHPRFIIGGAAAVLENPLLLNMTTGGSLKVNETITWPARLEIDMGERTAMMGSVNVLGSVEGNFWSLAVGINDIRVAIDNNIGFHVYYFFYENYLAVV